MVGAKIAQRELIKPDGVKEPAWVVTGEDGNTAVFSGPDGSERATTFARANYQPIGFVMRLETGFLNVTGQPLGAGADGDVQQDSGLRGEPGREGP